LSRQSPITAQQLAEKIGATCVGDGSRLISRCAPIESAGEGDLTFLANRKYAPHLETTRASAVVIDRKSECPARLTRLVADDPYFAFRNAMIALHGFREHPAPPIARDTTTARRGNISDLAIIHPQARVADDAVIHPNVVIERSASVGSGSVLYPGTYVGQGATIGDECILYPNVVIYDRCVLGNRVTLHAGCVIGSDGFGYATHKGAHHKIPQTGIVVIEDDVELGGACVIERAAMGETRIGEGTKFADLISIGHGTTIGKHCLFVSLVGVSGSVEVGDYVVLGGQVGVTGHLRIGTGVQAAGKTAIVADVPDGQKVGGMPAVPIDLAKRNALAGVELYDLFKRVKKIEKMLDSRDE
jgi:UDP-3-O-[3-hydroxymyristoyl] glucosamine N-acyltransferase